MPNGVSCAYFAAKNYMIGKKDDNVFRTGVAAAQTVRSLDYAAIAAPVVNNASLPAKIINTSAKIGKKLLYPLIVVSGIYNTVKSNDKVKTAVSQTGAISSMYACEQAAEFLLKGIDKRLSQSQKIINNKYLKFALYGLRGIAYASASIFGYDTGAKAFSLLVDKVRGEESVRNKIYSYYFENTDVEPIFQDIEEDIALQQKR